MHLRYQFDNPKIHTHAHLDNTGIQDDQLMPQPPYSPDFNRPIEHAHNIVQSQFENWLHHMPHMATISVGQPPSMQECMQQVHDIIHSIDKDSIRKDIEGLPELYDHVIKSEEEGGCAGGFAPKQFR
jgi:hypothetical protein